LSARGKREPERVALDEAAELEHFDGGQFVRLRGEPYEVGYQRGRAFGEVIRQRYQEWVVGPCESGALVPKTGWWRHAPSFLNLRPLALVRLAIGARPTLNGVPEPVFEELEGLADGAELPFDAAWLTHCMPLYADFLDVQELYRSPFCVMFAAVGDRAGADDVLVAHNFDWSPEDPVVVEDVQLESGRRFLGMGFPWSVGTYTGLNDAGLAVCVERVETLGNPTLEGPSVDLVARGVLGAASNFEEALEQVRAASHLRGYHVLLAALSKQGQNRKIVSKACVLECGDEVKVREAAEGLLLGIDVTPPQADPDAAARYGRVMELLRGQRIINSSEIQQVLEDQAAGLSARAQIRSVNTRCSAVLVPRSREMYLAVRQPDGSFGPYRKFALSEKGS